MLHSLTFLSQKVYLQTLPKLQIHLPIMKFGDFMCLKILQRLPLHHLWWKRHPSGLECRSDYHTEWCASRELLLLKPWLFVGSCCDCKEVTRWMHLCPAQSEFCSAPCQGAAFSRSFRCKSSPSHWCDPVPNWVVCSINKCLTKNRRKHTTRPLGQVVHGKKKKLFAPVPNDMVQIFKNCNQTERHAKCYWLSKSQLQSSGSFPS